MNLDDLMTVWRSQDVSPLHGVNETLLRLSLRQEDAKLQKWRRGEKWFTYLLAVYALAGRARELSVMINDHGDKFSGWDYAIPVIGAAAALLWLRLMQLRWRAQAVREQSFGDSLRDQINRQLAQLEYGARFSRLANLLGYLTLPIIWAFGMTLTTGRIHGRSFSDVWMWAPIVFLVFWCVLNVSAAYWWQRRVLQRKMLPRKQRLEGLLREIEG